MAVILYCLLLAGACIWYAPGTIVELGQTPSQQAKFTVKNNSLNQSLLVERFSKKVRRIDLYVSVRQIEQSLAWRRPL